MYPVGHVALGYLAGLLASRITREKFNTPLIWIVSLLPDLDLFIPFLEHRGPTHSIIVAVIAFTPIILTQKKGYPYLAALASHSTIGDYFTAYGCKLLWPLYPGWFKADRRLLLTGKNGIYAEILLFALMSIVLLLKNFHATTSRSQTNITVQNE
jgi:membrane-bound metal-dependent hydrolase YbcI (DUF457 family)